ncbi:MAG: DNA-processing protein DprA [Ruminiclostridium sp.]|nr:DNA-processing protein DprA [Ruminiclostridium sp.]
MQMEKYYIWLLLVFGEGEPMISGLIERFGTAEKAYEAISRNVALTGGDIIGKAEKVPLAKAEKLLGTIAEKGIEVISWESDLYPEHLRRIENPPCALFAFGDTSLLRKKLLTVVGSRSVTSATESAIPEIMKRLGREYAVVSTLSEGCDQLTCLNAMDRGISFIEVLPCGISHTYPGGSRSLRRFMVSRGGLIISEFLPKEKAGQGNFLRRSRILGGISYVTLVLQAGEHSGALATAEYSYAPLFLPPSDIFNPAYAGAVNAVRKGAKLYLSDKSISKAYERALLKEQESETAEKNRFRKPHKAGKPEADAPGSGAEKPRREASPAASPTPPEPEKQDKKAAPAKTAGTAVSAFEPETEDQSAVYSFIAGKGAPAGIEEIISATGLSAGTITEILLDLEIAGALRSEGNRYSVL